LTDTVDDRQKLKHIAKTNASLLVTGDKDVDELYKKQGLAALERDMRLEGLL